MSEVIEIVAYNPDWPRMFEDENGSDFQLQEEYTRRGAVSPGTFVPVLVIISLGHRCPALSRCFPVASCTTFH